MEDKSKRNGTNQCIKRKQGPNWSPFPFFPRRTGRLSLFVKLRDMTLCVNRETVALGGNRSKTVKMRIAKLRVLKGMQTKL